MNMTIFLQFKITQLKPMKKDGILNNYITHIMKTHNDIYPANTYLSDKNIDSIDVFDNENNHSQTSLAVLKFTQRHPNITFSIQP